MKNEELRMKGAGYEEAWDIEKRGEREGKETLQITSNALKD